MPIMCKNIFPLKRTQLPEMISNHYCHQEGKPRPWAVAAFSDHMAARCVRHCATLLAAKVRQAGASVRYGGHTASDHRVHTQAPRSTTCGVTPRKIATAAKTRVSHWSPLFSPLPEYYGQLAVSGHCARDKGTIYDASFPHQDIR